MEDGDGTGAGGEEPFLAGAVNIAGGVGAGTSAGGMRVPQVIQISVDEVQGILEKNRVLIHEISQNQENREVGGLTRNVSLIRELNTNISRVVDLYDYMSGSFAHDIAAKKAANAAAAAAAAAGNNGGPKRLFFGDGGADNQ